MLADAKLTSIDAVDEGWRQLKELPDEGQKAPADQPIRGSKRASRGWVL